jgi:hypothetical protein
VALKLDISKAYDRIDWDYLRGIMTKMGFSTRWVSWIMMCVESVDYNVIVNDRLVGPITPSRGLRQGDPLSPYLFILCAEGLSALIRHAEARGDIHGVKICRNAPIVSHLLFADDSFLFFRANVDEALVMKNILSTYELASGQTINFQKSGIFCSRNVSQPVRDVVITTLGVQAVLGTGKYLGLPSMIGRSKKAIFNFIKERVWKKINSWSSKCLSRASREVLIKSVLQAIPTYFMSIFLIPSTLCDEIEKMMNSFWWGHFGSHNKGIHWFSWERLSMHKNNGGMGFKDLSTFNLAMLGKQSWRILNNPQSLTARLLKARYFPNDNFLEANIGHNPSFVWRSLCSTKYIIREGSRWSIGQGDNISFCNDRWLGDGSLLNVPYHSPFVDHLCVSDILNPHEKSWNVSLISTLFDETSVAKIISTPLFPMVTEDRLIWRLERNGDYSVKSAYKFCSTELVDTSHLQVNGPWHLLWRIRAPPKVKNLLWRICRHCCPTRARLRDKGIECPTSCVLCEDHDEDSFHLFFKCRNSINIWNQTSFAQAVLQASEEQPDTAAVIFTLLQQVDTDKAWIFGVIIWSIWNQRNEKVWRNKDTPQHIVISRAMNFLIDWKNIKTVQTSTSVDMQVEETVIKWKKPSSGRIKCNIDAAFPSNNNRVGFGICIRDETGAFIRAKTEWVEPRCEVHVGEALGLLLALWWVHELNLGPVDFELDSKLVVDSFRCHRKDFTEFGAIIQHCKVLFSSFYVNSSVEFVRRQANEVLGAQQ